MMKNNHLSRHDESSETRCECQLGHDSCRKAFNSRMAGFDGRMDASSFLSFGGL